MSWWKQLNCVHNHEGFLWPTSTTERARRIWSWTSVSTTEEEDCFQLESYIQQFNIRKCSWKFIKNDCNYVSYVTICSSNWKTLLTSLIFPNLNAFQLRWDSFHNTLFNVIYSKQHFSHPFPSLYENSTGLLFYIIHNFYDRIIMINIKLTSNYLIRLFYKLGGYTGRSLRSPTSRDD